MLSHNRESQIVLGQGHFQEIAVTPVKQNFMLANTWDSQAIWEPLVHQIHLSLPTSPGQQFRLHPLLPLQQLSLSQSVNDNHRAPDRT